MSSEGVTIPTVRPDWRAVVAALVVGLLVYTRPAAGLAVVAVLLSLICTALWRSQALLGYIAGALTDDDEDDTNG